MGQRCAVLGSTRIPLEHGMQNAKELAAVEVLDVTGKAQVLGDSWAERTTALVFIRHFG